MNPIEGLTLGSRYTLTERIAAGGMGEVWKAYDSRLERVVAVKVMRPSAADEQEFVDRFRDEARHTASLQHPNIATVYDYGEDDGAAYLVMELVDGQPLSQLIARGAFAPDRVRSIMGQAALALAAAHAQGVVHRDVKPANILLTSEGRVKLTDFGIASAGEGSSHTRTGEVLGTPHYLSPEQATGRMATGASDIYALGIVAHEMLTGRKPFDAGSAVATALQQVNDAPPPLPPGVPADLARIVMSCLEKDPALRPASAASLAASLGLPVSGLSEVDPATSVIHTGHTDPSATAVIPGAAAGGTAVFPEPQPLPQDRPYDADDDLGTTPVSRRDLREQETEEKKRSRGLWWILPVVVALAAIAFLVYQFTTTGSDTPTPPATQTAPPVTVTSPPTTSSATSDTSSTTSTTSTTSSTTSTTPIPTSADIVVSDYVGKKESDVVSALNKLGFTNVGTQPRADDAAPVGTVVDVQPRGQVAFNNKVTVYVSSGPAPTTPPATSSPPTTPPATGGGTATPSGVASASTTAGPAAVGPSGSGTARPVGATIDARTSPNTSTS